MDKFANITIAQALEVIGCSAEQLIENLCTRAEKSVDVALEQSRKGAAKQLASANFSELVMPEPNLDEEFEDFSIPIYAKPLADSEGAINMVNMYLKTLIGVEGKFVKNEVDEPEVSSYYLSSLDGGLDLQTAAHTTRRKNRSPDLYGRLVIPNELSVCDLYALHVESTTHFGARMTQLLKKLIAKDKFTGTDYGNGPVDGLRAAFDLWSRNHSTIDIESESNLIIALTDEAVETMTKALAELPEEYVHIIQRALIKGEFTVGVGAKAAKKIKEAIRELDQSKGTISDELLVRVDKMRERAGYDYADHLIWQLMRIDFCTLARTYMHRFAPFKGTTQPEQWDAVSWTNVPTRR